MFLTARFVNKYLYNHRQVRNADWFLPFQSKVDFDSSRLLSGVSIIEQARRASDVTWRRLLDSKK